MSKRDKLTRGLLALCRDAHKDLNLRMLSMLIVVSQNDGIPMPVLGETLGLNSSAISRNVGGLGSWGRASRAGLGYVQTAENPENRKQKIVLMTTKGRNVLARFIDCLEKGE